MSADLCLVIPCFNEASRIKAAQYVPYAHQVDTFVFVNDGSSDNTSEVLSHIIQQLNNAGGTGHLVELPSNIGKGNAVRKGMLKAFELSKAQYYGMIDADASTPVSEIIRLTKIAKDKQAAIVAGARVALSGKNISRSATRHYIGRVAATLISLVLGLSVYDTQAGVKVFAREHLSSLFSKPFISPWLFDCEIFLHAKQTNLMVYEESLLEWQHVRTNSAIKPLSYLQALRDLFLIRLKR